MGALGSATLLVSSFLSEGALRWVGRCVAGALIILALVTVMRAAGEPD